MDISPRNYIINPKDLSKVACGDEEVKIAETHTTLVSESLESSTSTEDFPDGGLRAWVVVFGVLSILIKFASTNVFQAYYQQTILQQYSPSEIAWIGSVQANPNLYANDPINQHVQHSLVFLPGILAGRLLHAGFFRLLFIPSSSLIVIGTFLVPLCKVYWHFLLCQGLLDGFGCGMTFAPTATIVSEWWKLRRGIALGITTSGTAVGGCFFPIVVRKSCSLAFDWTFRILGFILLFVLCIANLCLRRRLPPTVTVGPSFGLRIFGNTAFALYSMSICFAILGGLALLSYVGTTAISIGLSRDFAFCIVAIVNGGSGVGRIISGLLGDRIGPLNTSILLMVTAAVVTIAWPFCSTKASLVAVCVIYGLGSSAFSALTMVTAASMGAAENLGPRIGSIITVIGLGTLCGTPLIGLLKGTDLGFKAVGLFGGT
ncbi:major facilitator superfamily domain-containing protein [Mycena vitilis]|nr:major facilitator superfamily domain-containing protein [Mycena vitilis]